MTLRELHALIGALIEHHQDSRNGDLEAVVETLNGGVPCRYATAVTGVWPGFDWTAGWAFLTTQDPVVKVRGMTERPEDYGRRRLDELKAYHAQLFGDRQGLYIAKAREGEWINGFAEGIRQHVTRCEPEERKQR